jgi:hypothetical protein
VTAGVDVSVAVGLAVALGGMGLDVCVLGMMAVLVGCGVVAAGWQAARKSANANSNDEYFARLRTLRRLLQGSLWPSAPPLGETAFPPDPCGERLRFAEKLKII